MRFLYERVTAILLGVILYLFSKIWGFKYEHLDVYFILGVLPLWMAWEYQIKKTRRKFLSWIINPCQETPGF